MSCREVWLYKQDGEDAYFISEFSFCPVLVYSADHCDDIILEEGQAILVLTLILVSKVKVVEGSAERGWLGQLLDDFHRAGWEEPTDPLDLPLVPVLIKLSLKEDDISFIKLQVARILPSVVVQGLGSRHPIHVDPDSGPQPERAGLQTSGAALGFPVVLQG